MMPGWQREPTEGPKGGWTVLFGMVAMVISPATAGCSVVWCSVV